MIHESQLSHVPGAPTLASQYPPHAVPPNKPGMLWTYIGTKAKGFTAGRWYYLSSPASRIMADSWQRLNGMSGHYFVEVPVHPNCPHHERPAPPLGKIWVHRGWTNLGLYLDLNQQTACYWVKGNGTVVGPSVKEPARFNSANAMQFGWVAIAATEEQLKLCRRTNGVQEDRYPQTVEAGTVSRETQGGLSELDVKTINEWGKPIPEKPGLVYVVISNDDTNRDAEQDHNVKAVERAGGIAITNGFNGMIFFGERGMHADFIRHHEELDRRKVEMASSVLVCGDRLTPRLRKIILHALSLEKPVRFDKRSAMVDLHKHDENQ